ncbi:MAG: hypothetical protein C0485_11360 [Pirellula sp.]|nr:hypothetical protein [Pirellula sp.]
MAEPNLNNLTKVADGRRDAHRAARLSHAMGLLACLAISALAGCRHIDNAQVDVLESELRKQEDYIYELEEYLMEYSEKLRQARAMQCETVVTPKSSSSGSSIAEPTLDVDAVKRPTLPMNGRNKLLAPSAKPTLPAPPATTEAPPAGAEALPAAEEPAPAAEEVAPDAMEAPALEIGPGVQALPFKKTFESAEAPLLIPDPIDYQADAEELVAEATSPNDTNNGLAASAASQAVELNVADETTASAPLLAAPQINAERLSADHLQIRRIFAERPEADTEAISSLLIVVEALNATDEPVGAEGEASLMIMTRDDSGAMRRIERWDFTPEETAAAWQSSQLGDGLHLELPLAKSQLPAGELELWARVVGADGRKLLTQIPLEPAQLASMADFNAEGALAAEEVVTPTPAAPIAEPTLSDEPSDNQVAVSSITKTAAEEPKPTWRPSSVKLNENRVEGFATTAGGPVARVASTASESSGKPTWKRSAAAAAGETKRDWAPFR